MDSTVENVNLIVKKHGSTLTDSTKGSVDILFVVKKSERGEEVSLPGDEFHTKGVFISNDYQDIESNFKNGELFSISCKTNDEFNPDDPQGRHDKWALGGWSKPLANSEYLPICKPPAFSGTLI